MPGMLQSMGFRRVGHDCPESSLSASESLASACSFQGPVPENRLPIHRKNSAVFLPKALAAHIHHRLPCLGQGLTSRPGLSDQPILDPDLVLYTKGTSLVKQGQ